MELRPSLQLFDADLKPVGSGFTMSPDFGTAEVSFSPGDKLVGAVGATDSEAGKTSVRVFDLATQKSLLPDPLQIDSMANIAVTDDGYLFVATKYGSITEYRVPSGEKVNELDKAHQRLIMKMAVSPDNKILATTADDDLIKLWSIPDLKPLGFLEAPNAQQQPWFAGLGFYDNNTVLDLTSEATGDLRLLPISGALDFSTWNVDSSESAGTCLAISSDGKQLAIGQANGVLTVVDNATGKRLFHVPANPGGIQEIEFAEGNYKLSTFGTDGKCLTWDLASSTNPLSETDDKPTLQTLAIETGTGPKKLHQGDPSNLVSNITVSPSLGAYRESEVSPHYRCAFNRMCALPGGKLLALSTWTNLYLYDLQSERLIWGFSVPSRPTGLVYDPLHYQLISSHEDGVTRRWVIPDSIQQTFPK